MEPFTEPLSMICSFRL